MKQTSSNGLQFEQLHYITILLLFQIQWRDAFHLYRRFYEMDAFGLFSLESVEHTHTQSASHKNSTSTQSSKTASTCYFSLWFFSLTLSPFQFYGSEFYVMGFQIALSHFPSFFFLFSVDAYRIFWILIVGSFFSLLLFLLAPLLFITMRWLFGFGYYDQSEEKKPIE